MFHKGGARMVGGNLPNDITKKIDATLDDFIEIVRKEVSVKKVRSAVVRSMLSCSVIYILDSNTLWIAAQKQSGMPSTNALDYRKNHFPAEEIYSAAKWEFGFDDPFIISIPAGLIEMTKEERSPILAAIANSHVESEIQRVNMEMNTIQINPIFGPAKYNIDGRLAFVLMPFTDELTEIYKTLVKPTIEQPKFNLVCKRADDVKSNKSIIQDIWKSICEARLIIADLTNLNPNVMYELGIAHTLGKETILIYQKNKDIRFPFDLSHIRRIEYENTVPGSKDLEKELSETVENVLKVQIRG